MPLHEPKVIDPSKLSPLGRDVLSALLKPGICAEELPAGDPIKDLADNLGSLFTEAVGFLKTALPNPELRKFGALVWDIVGNRVVPVGVGPNVPTVSFAGYKQGPVVHGIILLPPFWNKMIKEDPVMQLGAVVYSGSKAIDFYNNVIDAGTLDPRAELYESEYLRTVKQIAPDYEFNAYQKKVIAKYPAGLDSEGAASLKYESKPFFVPQA